MSNDQMRRIRRMPHRQPVLDTNSATFFDGAKVDRQWAVLGDAVRREILRDSTMRQILAPFTAMPVTERLPAELLGRIGKPEGLVSKLQERFAHQLMRYLALPQVPPKYLEPAVTEAQRQPMLYSQALLRAGVGREEFFSGDAFLRVTHEEVDLALRRFRYARDVKMLALAASMFEHRELLADRRDEVKLPSGIRVKLDIDDGEMREAFLNAETWKSRSQLKDRAYVVEVGGKQYVLKEKKTPQHRDTVVHKGCYVDGLSSSDEFAVARLFNERGEVKNDGGLSVKWEKPIGYAVFPDGFQFVVFEFEEDLQDHEQLEMDMDHLIAQIESRRDLFEDEYRKIAQRAVNFVPYVCIEDVSGANLELSFEVFAFVKALRLLERAPHLLKMIIAELGFRNDDADGFGYRLLDDGEAVLQVVGYDFERFQKIPAAHKAAEKKRLRDDFVHNTSVNLPRLPAFIGGRKEHVKYVAMSAAYLALMAEEGSFDGELFHLGYGRPSSSVRL